MADSLYYDVLGIRRTSTDSEVKNAYRKMALKWHPDKHEAKAKQLAEQKFRQIAEAYVVLSDPKKRARYDQHGLEGLHKGGASGAWTFQQNPREVFSDFFGQASAFTEIHGGSSIFQDSRDNKPKQAPPLEQNLYLSLEELSAGAQKKVKIVRQVLSEDRRTTRPSETVLSVDVKAGWREGTKLTFPGAGDESLDVEPGDIVLTIREKPHPRFTRQKHDLIYTASISLLQSLVGCTVEIETLDSRVIPVAVTEIVTPGFIQVVPGEGMPSSKDPTVKGNLLIKFNVIYPSMLSIKQKEQLELILPQ